MKTIITQQLMDELCQNRACEPTFISVKNGPAVMFCLMLLAAGSSKAMSLGVHHGAAIVGRPLDISVQAMLGPAEDPAGLCLEADVFYADNKLAKSWVRVTADKARSTGQGFVIHIRSALAVSEPVVVLHLRAGCPLNTERRYVLLADLAPDLGSVQLLPQLASARPGPTDPGTIVSKRGASASAGPVAAATGKNIGRAFAHRTPGLAADASRSSDIVDPLQIKAGRSLASQGRRGSSKEDGKYRARLKLEPIELAVDRQPSLRASAELNTVPASSPEARSAAGALWRALTAQPEDFLRDAEKLQSLELSVQSLQADAQKNRLLTNDLTSQVTQARSERYANGLVYTLGALLLSALVAIVYLMRRRIALKNSAHDHLPWWKKSEAQEKGWSNSALGTRAPLWDSEGPLDSNPGNNVKAPDAQPTGLDLDLDLRIDSPASPGTKHVASRSGIDSGLPSRRDRPDFALSMTPSRAVKAEELFDVQQKADFFVSLGQHEQAIDVLRNHIGENVQTSALVYLDLFDLYHQLKRQEDYEALRREFNGRFNSKIPPFELFNEKSPGLDAYQAALTRIEALWPSRKVLEVIEESIFRQPNAGEEAFDLEAYRELLILYAVAREIISPETVSSAETLKLGLPGGAQGDDPRITKFLATTIQPLSASIASVSLRKQREQAPGPKPPAAAPRSVAVDIDLDQSTTDLDGLPYSSESDSHFFAQLAGIPVKPPVSAHLAQTLDAGLIPVEPGNLIDFNLLDSAVKNPSRT